MENTDSGPQADWADASEDVSEELSSKMDFSGAVRSGLLNDRNRTSSRNNSTSLFLQRSLFFQAIILKRLSK